MWIVVAILATCTAAGTAVAVAAVASGHHSASANAASSSNPEASTPSSQGILRTETAPPTEVATSPTSTAAPPYAGNSVVSVAPAAGHHPLAPTAVGLLTRYFNDIDNRTFDDYIFLFSQDMRAELDPATLADGYRSTSDSGGRVTELGVVADGRTAATVTFTSHQDAADGPDGETCTNWTVKFFLQRESGGYVFGPHPSDYHALHVPC